MAEIRSLNQKKDWRATGQKFTIALLIFEMIALSSCHDKNREYTFTYDKYYEIYTPEELERNLFSDTLAVGPDIDSGNTERLWYAEKIQALILDLQDDWGKADSLYPITRFDEICISKNSVWSKKMLLTNKQANELMKILTNPTSFDWSETTYEEEFDVEFLFNGRVVSTLTIGADNSVVKTQPDWPLFKKMKFGHLRSESSHALQILLTDIGIVSN